MKSFCLTPDRKDLITYEELIDSNSHKEIFIQAVKFWHRESTASVDSFEMLWMIQNPCEFVKSGIIIEVIGNGVIVMANGPKI